MCPNYFKTKSRCNRISRDDTPINALNSSGSTIRDCESIS